MDQLFASPPTSFSGFATMAEPISQSDLPAAKYRLGCASCGHERFMLQEVLSGEYGAAGIEATCSTCGHASSVFHASRDGYDGRLGHLRFLEPITERRPLKDDDQRDVGESLVACAISFSVDPDELMSIAAEGSSAPQDLFDWFVLYARDREEDQWRCVWEYECA